MQLTEEIMNERMNYLSCINCTKNASCKELCSCYCGNRSYCVRRTEYSTDRPLSGIALKGKGKGRALAIAPLSN